MFNQVRKKLAGWLDPVSRSISSSWDGGGYLGGGYARPTLSGTSINSRTALSISAVWAAVNVYANTIGTLDFYVAERDDRGGRRPAHDHPAYDLIHSRPNPLSTSIRLRQAWIGHALTHGNGYLEITWDARGRYATGLHLMDPREVEPYLAEDGELWYRLNRSCGSLHSSDVLHLAMFGWDGIRGHSPITIGAETLGVATAQRTYQAGLFGNSAAMQGHIEVPQKLNTKQKAELRDDYNKIHQGPGNAGNLGVLDGGMKWVQTSFSPQDAEMILGARFSVEEIARFFGLPQHFLGLMEHANFSTLEEMNIQFYQMSILPWLVAIEQECNNKLLGPIERQRYFIRHDVSTLLRGNSAAQRAQEDADLASGVKSINEIRIARGDNPLDHPAADFHWIQAKSNLQAIETMMPGGNAEPVVQIDPDDATDQDPTTVKPAPETPAPLPPGTIGAVRDVLHDAAGRMLRRECNALRRAAKKDRFDDWAIDFYAEHTGILSEAISPACRALGTILGGTATAHHLAGEWGYGSLARLKSLWTTTPPDEMPAAVDRVCREWEADRVGRFVDYVAGGAGS